MKSRLAVAVLAVLFVPAAWVCATGCSHEGAGVTPAPDAAADGIVAAHDGGGDASDATADGSDARADGGADAVADGPAAFTPPADMRDRIGVYAWGFDPSAWPGTPDQLTWATNEVAGLGGRTVRVYLGPQDIYGVLAPGDAGAFDLATAATSGAYRALFANPSFDTYLLTTYSSGDDANDWTAGYTAAQIATERQEIAALGSALLSTFPGKTFVILNWEGDNALAPVATSQAAWDGYTAWIGARSAGVADARKAAAATTARLYFGLEFNLVRSLATNAPCDTSANKCVISVVAPQVDVDFYSYSSWQSLGPNLTPAQVAAGLQADLTSALGYVKEKDGGAGATPAQFLVGEFGAPREQADLGECAAMQRAAAIVPAIVAWGAAYGVFWQIIDNRPSGQPDDFVDGFGLYKASGPASLSAALFQTLYATQVATPPVPPGCPLVSQGGVVNGTTFSAGDIDGGTTLSIFGTGFTDAGDVVHVREATAQWSVQAGSPFFYASPGQINATLPGIPGGQNALVFVTGGDGVDSNGQIVSVGP
ncbi:MAG TPA: IPT/TIG domain-containing protein [Polyangiaceae bacterium]|jgi:hypothetical protein